MIKDSSDTKCPYPNAYQGKKVVGQNDKFGLGTASKVRRLQSLIYSEKSIEN